MKRIFALTPLIGLILLMTSCVSTKKIVYFQGSDSIFSQAQDIMQQYEMKLKPADQILIKLTCSEPELLNIFAQDVVMGTAGSSISTNITNQGNMTNAYAYTVTNDGYIILPAVGKVKVEGMTTDETAKRIEESIQEKNLIIELFYPFLQFFPLCMEFFQQSLFLHHHLILQALDLRLQLCQLPCFSAFGGKYLGFQRRFLVRFSFQTSSHRTNG